MHAEGGVGAVHPAADAFPSEAAPRERRWSVLSPAYPAALAAATVSLAVLGVSARSVFTAALLAVLVLLSAIDLRYRLLPNVIVLPATAATLLVQLALAPDRMGEWLAGALGAGALLLVPSLIKPGSIGMGDVKLAALLGAALGAEVLSALMVGFLAVGPVALVLVALRGAGALGASLPLGPFLTLGAAVVLLG